MSGESVGRSGALRGELSCGRLRHRAGAVGAVLAKLKGPLQGPNQRAERGGTSLCDGGEIGVCGARSGSGWKVLLFSYFVTRFHLRSNAASKPRAQIRPRPAKACGLGADHMGEYGAHEVAQRLTELPGVWD
ncbi:unnamed protein product [Arctogadus glacialis]